MNEYDFAKTVDNLTRAFSDGTIKRKKTINALIVDDIISKDDQLEQGIVTYEAGMLEINGTSIDTCVLIDDCELWQILAFALDNGLELPNRIPDEENN